MKSKPDVRAAEDMLDPSGCDHSRTYEGSSGFIYCADCPYYEVPRED